MLQDESFHPLEFDYHLFFNKDSRNQLPSSWITSNAHPIIERVSFLGSSFSSCLSCLSMFPKAANRFNGTWSLLPIGHKDPLFHSRLIRTVGRATACLKPIVGVFHQGYEVTPRSQNCRSILVTLVVEGVASVFVSLRVSSCPFVVHLHERSAVFPRMIRTATRVS